MAKMIDVIVNLVDRQAKKQLNDLENKKYKVNVDIDKNGISEADKSIKQLGSSVASTNTTFGKLKNTISNTFSTARVTMTAFLMVLHEINKAGRQAKETIQDIDKSVTDLSIATNMSREATAGLVKEYNSYAKKLKSTTTQITSAADDYLRAGKTMSETKALIEDSVILSKLGQIETPEATEDLLATMNGFEMSVEEVGSALDAMVAIDMKAATSAGDIATALKYSASSADMAGLSFNKLASMIGAVQDKTQQSAETVGTFMNTLLSRYRNVKIGQFVSDDGEDLSEVETVLKSLDIKLRDSNQEFRNFELVIDEVAMKWENYSSVQQAAIAKAFSGTRQQNRFIALMEGYGKVLELTEVAANSVGTALEKFNNSYENSLEAKQNDLQASFESMVINSDMDEIYSSILDATTALVDFINHTNALKGVMTGLAVSSGIKGFLTLRTAINESYIALNQFSNALKIVKQTNIATADFDKLLLLTRNLSDSQMKMILSSKSLTVAQKELLLINSGLSVEEAQLQLQTWGLTTAQTGLTVATTTLGNAIRGLWSTLIANPIVAVTVLVSGLTMAYQSYNQKLEETRQKNIEASESAIEHANSLKGLYNEYTRLSTIQSKSSSEEEEFKAAVEDVTKALGDKAKVLEGLTVGTNEYAQALENATKEELKSASVNATIGRKSAEEELQADIWSEWNGSQVSVDSNSKGQALSEEAQKAVNIVSGALKDFETMNKTWKNISWDISSDNPEKALEFYNALIKAREKLVLASENDETLLDTEIYTDINTAINAMSDSLDSYISKRYEEEKLKYMAANGIPQTIEEYTAMQDSLMLTAGASADLQDAFKTLLMADFSSLVNEIEGVSEAQSELGDSMLGGVGYASNITTSIQQIASQLEPQFTKLGEAYKSIFSEDGFTLENVDTSMLEGLRQSFAEIEEEVGVAFNSSKLETFFDALTRGDSTAEQVQQAFNDVATAYLYSTDTLDNLNSKTAESIQKQLEEMGVVNAKEVVYDTLSAKTEALALQEQFLAENGVAIANATNDKVVGFLNEAGASETARAYLFQLVAAEQVFSSQDLNTAEKIAKLKELANAYGQTAIAARIANLEKANEDGHVSIDYDKELASLQNEINNAVNNVQINFSGISGGSSGKEAADAYKEAFEKELGELDDLKSRGKISEKQFLDALRRLYQKYYRDKEKYLKEYEKHEHDYLDGMKSLYESAFSYITSQIDKRIDSLNNEKDSAVSALEAERDARLEAIELQKEQIENEIDGIEKQIEAKEKEIEVIRDANEERKEAINLQKAQYELERLQNQHTSFVYKDGKGMVYEADTAGIRDARQEVEDAKQEIEISKIEKEISLLEDQRDVLQEQIDLLDKQSDSINKYYDNLIKQTEAHYDSMIQGMENYKSQFEEFSDLMENVQMEGTLQELGINIDALLGGSQEEFEKLKTAYVGILADMGRGNDEVLNQLSKLSGISAESVSYLDATKGAFDNLGQVSLGTLPEEMDAVAASTSELSSSANEASTTVGNIGSSVSTATESISPFNNELTELKGLIEELTTLFTNLKFPAIGEEGYAEKLSAVAEAFGKITEKCEAFSKINFSFIIGVAGTSSGQPQAETQTVDNAETSAGSGFMGLATAIQNAVAIIQLQMTNLDMALDVGDKAFDDQIAKIKEEYIPAWEDLQTRLAEIIGVGGGTGEKKDGKDNPKGKSEESEPSADSIIGIMQAGGEEVKSKLNDPWLQSFKDFATGENSVESISNKIKEIVEEMAKSIQEQCANAAAALDSLAEKAFSINGTTGGGIQSGGSFSSGTNGELSHPVKNAMVGDGGLPEVVIDKDKGEYTVYSKPSMVDLDRGDTVLNGKQTKEFFNGKGNGVTKGETFADGSFVTPEGRVLRPLQPGDKDYELYQKAFKYFGDMQNFIAPTRRMMEQMTESMMDMNKVVNTNNAYQQTIQNTYNVSLPNVTNESSAIQLMNELKQMSRDTYQYTHRK